MEKIIVSYYSVLFALCISSVLTMDSTNSYVESAREVFNLYNECSKTEGLSPCLKLKALSIIDRVSRMEKIALFDGVVLKGSNNNEETAQANQLEEEEKNLPRGLEAKNEALTTMILNRLAKMIGSKSIEVSVPALIESARKKDEDSKFGDLEGLFGGDGHKGGHGGGGHGGGKLKMKKKGGNDLKDFLMMVMAHKLALFPLLIGGLFILAIKALTQAKIALLIAGIIFAKKLIASKNSGNHAEHVQASGWSGGASSAGGAAGWGGGWDRRSLDDAQNLAYSGQKQ